MKIDLELELPSCSEPDFSAPRLNTDEYIRFIEFNQSLLRDSDVMQQILASRSQPVDEMFTLD